MAKVLLESQQALNNSKTINQSIGQFYNHHNVSTDNNGLQHDEFNQSQERRATNVSKQLKQLQSQSWDNMSTELLSKPVRAIISGSSIVSMDTQATMGSDLNIERTTPPPAPRLRCIRNP